MAHRLCSGCLCNMGYLYLLLGVPLMPSAAVTTSLVRAIL